MTSSDTLSAMETEVAATMAAQLDCVCGPDPAAISAEMARAFGVLGEFIGRNRLQPSGPPRAIYTAYGPDGVKITLAVPIAPPAEDHDTSGTARIGELPAARTLRFTHKGPYRELRTTYGRITAHLMAEGLIESEADWGRFMPMWEEYPTDPHITAEAELLTWIHLPMP